MDAKTTGLSILGSASIDGQGAAKQTIYTVPAGKIMVPYGVQIDTVSASLAGLVDMDIGGEATPADWILQVTLAGLTGTTHQTLILQPSQAAGPPIVPVQKTVYAAAIAFGLIINTGSTGVATFNARLIGYLYDA